MKTCKSCGESRSENDFRVEQKADGRMYTRGMCKHCRNARNRVYKRQEEGSMPTAPNPVPRPYAPAPSIDLVPRLVELTHKGPVSFTALCDKLDLSPVKCRALIDRATSEGYLIHLENDHVAVKLPVQDDRVQRVKVEPTVGDRKRVAVISDLHFGSRYCLREQLIDFVEYAYGKGVREILCPGDMLDGNYVKHGLFELSHVGLDNQAEDMIATLPALPGLTYHAITGNHDLTFTEQNGVDVGRLLQERFKAAGRNDLKVYGNRGAFLEVHGINVHLWHPMGGGSYARSYKLQKRVEAYASGEKPAVLLAGHWHMYCHIYERGVHAMACPTFQGGGSAFGKAIGGAPAIGGLLLEWDLTAHGTIRNFSHEVRSYFEVEKPQRID